MRNDRHRRTGAFGAPNAKPLCQLRSGPEQRYRHRHESRSRCRSVHVDRVPPQPAPAQATIAHRHPIHSRRRSLAPPAYSGSAKRQATQKQTPLRWPMRPLASPWRQTPISCQFSLLRSPTLSTNVRQALLRRFEEVSPDQSWQSPHAVLVAPTQNPAILNTAHSRRVGRGTPGPLSFKGVSGSAPEQARSRPR